MFDIIRELLSINVEDSRSTRDMIKL